MPWYMTDDADRVEQIGELWYVTRNGHPVSQGYRTQTMADLRRQAMERERKVQQQTFVREGEA